LARQDLRTTEEIFQDIYKEISNISSYDLMFDYTITKNIEENFTILQILLEYFLPGLNSAESVTWLLK